MSIRPYRDIIRRKSRQVMVGPVPVGGAAPITVQTMTNTLTADAEATIAQIRRCEEAGVDIIRVSCPDEESTKALHKIGAEYSDLSYIAWAYEQEVRRTSFAWGQPAAVVPPLPWTNRDAVLRRDQEIQRLCEEARKPVGTPKTA